VIDGGDEEVGGVWDAPPPPHPPSGNTKIDRPRTHVLFSPKAYTGTRWAPFWMASFTNPRRFLSTTVLRPGEAYRASVAPPSHEAGTWVHASSTRSRNRQ
jgi:hypothetical protein